MILKLALLPSLLHLGAIIVLLYLSCQILAHSENEKKGLVILSVRPKTRS
jgi:hypothetical protein